MIKRILLALILVAAALGLMHLVIGFENFASGGSSGSTEPVRQTGSRVPGVVVGTTDGDAGSAVAVSVSGRFEVEPKVERTLADGSRKRLRRYRFVAEDSGMVSADLVHLDRVTVLLFRIADDLSPPVEEHVATITAREALVQLGRDSEGKPSIREDRDMDLAEVVLVSAPGSKLRDLRLEIGRALVRQDSDGLRLRTPNDRQSFTLTSGEGLETKMTGRGLDGFFPRVDGDPSGTIRFDIAHDPDVTRGGLHLRADGKLEYREDVATGVGVMDMRDGVVVDGVGAQLGETSASATGDVLHAILQRSRPSGGASGTERADWRALTLRGSQAKLTANGIELSCDELITRPAIDGQPAWFTARGAPVLTDPIHKRTFTAERRIHLVDLTRLLAPLHRVVGFPAPRLGMLAQRLVLFEGIATVDDRSQGVVLSASDGMRVLQSDAGLHLVRGAGKVRVDTPRFGLESDRGFLLTRNGDTERVRLGPSTPDATHRFDVTAKGDPERTATLGGHGACELFRNADESVRIAIRSPGSDVTMTSGTDEVRNIETLDALLGALGVIQSLVATGAVCEIESMVPLRSGTPERLKATGQRIESFDGRGIAVIGTPAEVIWSGGGSLVGGRIDIRPYANSMPAVVVRGTPAQVVGLPLSMRTGASTEGSATVNTESIDLESSRITFLPSLLPSMVLRAHGIGARSYAHVARPHVIADGAVTLRRLDHAQAQVGIARGDRLLLRPDADAALLFGTPAELSRKETSGRVIVARGDRLRGTLHTGTARIVLEPGPSSAPEIDFLGPSADSSFGDLRVISSVPIVLAGDHLLVDGAVRVLGLDEDHEIDPDGMDVTAMRLDAELDPATGGVRVMNAINATMDWRGMKAFAERVTVDVTRGMVEIESRNEEGAWVELGGWRHHARLIQIDYETREMRAWNGGARPVRIGDPISR